MLKVEGSILGFAVYFLRMNGKVRTRINKKSFALQMLVIVYLRLYATSIFGKIWVDIIGGSMQHVKLITYMQHQSLYAHTPAKEKETIQRKFHAWMWYTAILGYMTSGDIV